MTEGKVRNGQERRKEDAFRDEEKSVVEYLAVTLQKPPGGK